ncbi:MAG TPA: DEAD/DEAH box helicase [Puia sp.]|uniref:DEAD/DEAH box helicase n=1 Tax=Puia sp. TaxID=2045100 RepID=UPI002BC48375|nr:DEAD/DEAH box helicase [Puia sp.]HVU93731.1 DEAD/DEAH box helicase [Puia sp.]
MEIFETCHSITDLLHEGSGLEARNELIRLLDYHTKNNIPYTPLLNHLIREVGLFPYQDNTTSSWQDRYIYEVFKVDVGGKEMTLHKEQSFLLRRLLQGENIAVSAPTSFGKSFVIDAFIAIKKPTNVVIIVPTIALTDETRRRLFKKFSDEYKIITTTDVPLGEKNILIFPQERAFYYIDKIESLDILIVDEFYKASSDHEDERAGSLLKAILKLGQKAKQKYYLAPNISGITDNIFTKGMTFEKLDFNTVCLEVHETYKKIKGDDDKKGQELLNIIRKTKTKSIIYAASYGQIKKVTNVLLEGLPVSKKKLLNDFSDWLTKNYDSNWELTNLIKKGVGIHNGQLHRSLAQIQIKVFEEQDGIENIVTTSSIIEGVNTSAENVIIWRNRRSGSNKKLDSFTYKNIIGRGGRMFKHFIGKIYLLEAPPSDEQSQLDIQFPEEILSDIDETDYKDSLTKDQVQKIVSLREDMYRIIGKGAYDKLVKEHIFQTDDADFIKRTALEMKENPSEWNGLSYLNSDDPQSWERLLNKLVWLKPGGWGDGAYGVQHPKFVAFVKILSENWSKSIPELLDDLDYHDVDIASFFHLERIATFKLSSLVNQINILQRVIINNGVDVSPFVAKVSNAFLPPIVYELEEYGLPRMISKKIHTSKLIDLVEPSQNIHDVLDKFRRLGIDRINHRQQFDRFDLYIINYFLEGISTDTPK